MRPRLRRDDFVKFLAAAVARPAMPAAAMPAPQSAANKKTEEFVVRLIEDMGAGCRGALGYIGDRLGIFKAMAGAGPLTAQELAKRTGLNARLLREWLNAMATADWIEYRPAGKKYFLSPEHAAVLADEENSPAFLGGFLQLLVPMVAVGNRVSEAFRTGKPISMDDFAPELFQGMERLSAPNFKHRLAQEWIPKMPQVSAKLRAGGTAADVGCGSGLASIMLAKAFPKARFQGYDPHAPSIARARANAKKAGVAERVTFEAAGASALPQGRFDLITCFDSIHHFPDPVGILSSIRKGLALEGVLFALEPALSPNVEDNKNPFGRMSYAATTIWCLQDSMANNGAGIGSDMSEPLMRELARKSGFTRVRRLPNENPYEGLWEMRT